MLKNTKSILAVLPKNSTPGTHIDNYRIASTSQPSQTIPLGIIISLIGRGLTFWTETLTGKKRHSWGGNLDKQEGANE